MLINFFNKVSKLEKTKTITAKQNLDNIVDVNIGHILIQF